MATDVRLLESHFAPAIELGAFAAAHLQSGGIASFLGQVRGKGVEALELSHYAPLTLPGMDELAQATLARWVLDGLLVVHRVGQLEPGDPIVLVAAAAQHRRAAMQAVDYMMDHLKSASWFWKRELRGGQWRWIEPRPEDHADRARWQ